MGLGWGQTSGARGRQYLGDFPVCAWLKAWASLELGDAEDWAGCQDLPEVPGEGQKLLDMAVSACLPQLLLLHTVSATATRPFSW